MTDEIRIKANELYRQLMDLEGQIAIVEDMHHCDNKLFIRCNQIGEVIIAGDDELKDDLLDIILNRLNAKKGEVEDEYRML